MEDDENKTKYVKYPRTLHLPWSLGKSDDDKALKDTSHFIGRRVVITEKMDGENTTLYNDYYHARSINENGHPSRNWVKKFHSSFSHQITEGYRLCGENLYAVHSIEYEVSSFFMLFSVWNENNECLSWKDTLEWADKLGITPVPVLYEGVWDESAIKKIQRKIDFNKSEGYVVRVVDGFNYANFEKSVAKFVRQNHVQSDKHWSKLPIRKNNLK